MKDCDPWEGRSQWLGSWNYLCLQPGEGHQPSQAVMKSGDSQESEVVFLACGEASGSPGKQKLVRSIRQSPGEGEAA